MGINVFLTIYAWWKKDPDSEPDPYLWLMDPDAGVQKHVDSTDPGLQHRKKEWIWILLPFYRFFYGDVGQLVTEIVVYYGWFGMKERIEM